MEFDPDKFAAKMAAEVRQEQQQVSGIIGMHRPSAEETMLGAEFAAAIGLGPDYPVARRRARVWTLLMLLQPAFFMSGLWREVPGGYYDSRAKKIFSFEECEVRIDARILELGLEENLVKAFLSEVWDSLEAERSFERLPFSEKMKRFKK